METVIQFKNIKKSYGKHPIINNLSLKILKGEFITVIGTSGSGKTTLLKMINGLIMPDEGEVLVNDENIINKDLINLRRNIGYSIQGSILFPHMTVEENISYVPNLLNKRDKKKTKNAIKKWMDIIGLDETMIDRYPSELSGGQQQRVGIARALAASPDILLMDEPFGAVDKITKSNLQDEILRIHKKTNITIIFVTHDIEEAIKLGSRILVMNCGEIEQFDTPENIINFPATEFVEKLVKGKD